MCIGILNNKNTLSKKHLNNSWENNSDGAGLLWVENKKLKVFKELDNFDVFYKKYIEIRGKIRTPIVLHFRIGTHGLKNVDNLHPFLCSEEVGFVHNGIISGWGNSIISDTNHFNLDILSKLPKGFEQNEASLYLIQESIGYSKLIFLNIKNKVSIVGEEDGSWAGSDWFSNDSYKELNSYVYYGNIKKEKSVSKEVNWWKEEEDYYDVDFNNKDTVLSKNTNKTVIDTCDACSKITNVELLDSGFTRICKPCNEVYMLT